MKKLLFIVVCCMMFCGCGNKEEKLKQTECTNQSNGQITTWTLYHDGNKIYKLKREHKKQYDTLSKLQEEEQSKKEYYNSMKKKYEEQGNKVSIDISQSDHSLIEKIVFDCGENNFFPNISCDYQKEIKEFENDIISFTCIEKD